MKKLILLAIASVSLYYAFAQSPVRYEDPEILQIRDTLNGTGTVNVFKDHYTYTIVYCNYMYPNLHESLSFTGAKSLKTTMQLVKKLYTEKSKASYQVNIANKSVVIIQYKNDQVYIIPSGNRPVFITREEVADKIISIL